MALIKPVEPVNYGELLMQGLQAGQGFQRMQASQQENKYLQEKRRAESEERFNKERTIVGATLHNKDPEFAINYLDERLSYLKENNRDPSNTLKLRGMYASNDPQQIQQANYYMGQAKQEGEALGYIPTAKKSAVVQEAERLYPGDLQSQNSYIRKSRFKPQTALSINTQGVGEEQKALAKSRVVKLGQVQEKAEVAQNNIASLDRLDAIDVSTGKAEPMKQAIAEWGKSFGIDTSKLANVAAGQALTAEAGRVVLNVMAAQKGPQTESDMKQIKTTVAGLGKDPRANQFINDSARAMSRRSIEQRDFYETYLDENETLKGASKEWNDFKRNTPMVSKFSKDKTGLPVFFFRFYDRVKEANPNATRDQIIGRWKQLDIPVWKEANLNTQSRGLTPAPLTGPPQTIPSRGQ